MINHLRITMHPSVILQISTLSKRTIVSSPILSAKFRAKVAVKPIKDFLNVTLDGKPLRTPAGNEMRFPTQKQLLARAVALEWAKLDSMAVKQHDLPLTSVCGRVIDFWANAAVNSTEHDACVERLLHYLDTDTILVLSPSHEYEGALRKAQDNRWMPLRDWASKKWQAALKSIDGNEGILGSAQSDDTKHKVKQWIMSLSPWQLAVLEQLTMSLKSFILAAMVASDEIHMTEALDLATLEQQFQTARWGEVEDAHDVEKADLRLRTSCLELLLI